MNTKLLLSLLIAASFYTSCGAALRRTPKVYNALITTDDNLSSSRAYPVIQPTIHEPGYTHYPFGPYNPFGFYNPPTVRFGQPIAPGLNPRQQLPYPLPPYQIPPQFMNRPLNDPAQAGYPAQPIEPNPEQNVQQQPQPQPEPNEVTPEASETAAQQQPQPTQPQQPPTAPNRVQSAAPNPNSNLPFPLNEFGYPPALVPLPQQQQQPYPYGNPVSLPPYNFNQYPLLFDPITGLRQQYLPPYDYYPPAHHFPRTQQPQYPQLPNNTPPSTTTLENSITTIAPTTEATNFDSIKNGSSNKNSDVPDVPPPPIPSGAKQ